MLYNDKWMALEEHVRQEIVTYAMEYGAWRAADRYHEVAGMELQGMYVRLKKLLPTAGVEEKVKVAPKARTEEVETELTKDEEVFLERVKNGDVSLEEASRKIAGIVFEKMLRNPNNVKFDAFFKTKLLELKQTEVQDRNNMALSLINGMFNGRLPPKMCPNCGHVLYQEVQTISAPAGAVIEGEIDD